jgi:multidrug efflux pump subunit AcrB
MAEKQQRISYLSQLHFDPDLKNKWWAKYIVNIRLVILLILSIVAVGTFSFISIPRRLNPEVKIPIVVISTVLPGAAPADVESLATIPIEDKVNNVKGIDTMVSSSRENVSVIQLQFLSSVNGDKALQDVQTALGGNLDLPTDAQTPSVSLVDFEDQPVWEFAVTTTADTASLMRFSRELRDKLKDLPKIDRVELSGFDTQEIQVIIDPVKVNEYGINPAQLSQLVKNATASYPAGSIHTDNSTFALSIDKDVTDIADLRNLRLTAPGGRTFLLADVASIIERSKNNQARSVLAYPNGKPMQTVGFFVYKSKNVNIDAAEKDAKKIVTETIAQYHGKFAVTTILNSSEEILKQFADLYSDFQSTIILVFVLLLIFLGFKQAVISSLTVPLTFLSTFAIINAMGLSLNFLTAFAFLIALGLLIDDTIVSVAAMTRYFRTGKFTASETGILVWRDFIVPLWSTTITTIWAFVPLLLASGIIGEFIKSIPIVVTATMLSSTTVAVLITLPLMIIILKPKIPRRVKILLTVLLLIGIVTFAALLIPQSVVYPMVLLCVLFMIFLVYQIRSTLVSRFKNVTVNSRYTRFSDRFANGFINIESLSERYKNVIDIILLSKAARRSTLIAIIVFAVVGYALVGFGFVKSEFFPKTDEDLLYVQVDLPAGTNVDKANSEMISFVEQIKKTEEVNFLVADSGVSYDSNMGGRNGESGSFLITLHLFPKDKRHVSSQDLSERIRERLKTYTKGTVSVIELSGGPPAGADIQISFLGNDLATIDGYANKMVDFLKKQPRVTNVTSSNKSSTSKIVFVPDKVKMAEANISTDMLGLWLRTYASGFTLDTIKVNNEDTDITFQMGKGVPTPQELGSLTMPGQNGPVQLLSLGTLQLTTNPTSISRENGKRRITVSGGVTKGASATEINKDVEKFANSLQLPQGYFWQTGGVNEENQKSVQSILQAMVISFLLILITMVIEFGSFRQTLIALLIIPLGISGVFYVFALTGTPLSFPALIGILALFGIVVTHAIVVIEKINDNRKHGMNLHDSLVDAAGNRLEPVLLTSLATIVGLIPITLSDPLWRGLGGAIIAGLLFSGAIKLFFVPVMYYNWFKGEEDAGKGQMAKSEEKSKK